MPIVRRAAYGLVFMLLCTVAAAAEAPAASPVKVNIDAQRLDKALNAWAQQTGFSVMVPVERAAQGRMAPKIDGNYTPEEALKLLLAATDLRYEFVDARTVAIRPPRTKDGRNGSTRMTGEQGAGAVRLTQSVSPEAQTSEDNAQEKDDGPAKSLAKETQNRLSEVIVTGSRLKRADDTGPAPVTAFDRERIEELGVSNVADVLNYLPQQPFANNEQGNFGGARGVRLRGLASGTTLVLINGRRTVSSALLSAGNYFDLNTIPLAAVERIEVLSNSSSAIYGADAMGGVVNVILKDDVEHPVLDLYYGSAEDGAQERRASLTLGHSGERFRGGVTADFFERDVLNGADRSLYADQDFRRFGSTDRRFPFSNPANITSTTIANLPGLPSRIAAVPVGSTGVGLTPSSFLATAGQQNLASLNRLSSVVPEAERRSATGWGEFQINERISAFGELIYANRDDLRLNPPSVSSLAVPAANPFNPFGVPVLVNYLFTGVGPRSEYSEAESLRGVLGLKGDLRSWDWEVSAMNIDDDGANYTLNAADPARVAASLASTDPNSAFNPFQDGPGGSPALLRSLAADPIVNNYASKALQGGAFLRGTLMQLPSGAMQLVLGAEARKEEIHFEVRPTTIFSADRRVQAAYAEMGVPLFRDVDLTLAGRYDHYSDFGGTFNPQYGLTWKPNRQVVLRASYGTSFRAPSLYELFNPPVTFSSIINDPRRNNQPTAGVALLGGGNRNLEPEEGNSFVTGVLLTPEALPDFRAGLNYWRVKQSQRIQVVSQLLVLANENALPDRVVRAAPSNDPVNDPFPTVGRLVSVDGSSANFGSLRTDGLDLELSTVFHTPVGQISPRFLGTWVNSFKAASLPSLPIVERVGFAQGGADGTIPEWRATGTLAWSAHGAGAAVTARYISSYDDATQFNVRNGRRVDAQTLVDLQGSLALDELFKTPASWLRGIQIRAGAINLLDKQPNFSEVGGLLGFDPSQGDPRGRFIYGAISKSF